MYRSTRNAVLGGVCSGIAQSMDVSPWAVRGMFIVFLVCAHFFAVLTYFVMWMVIPDEQRPGY